MVEESQNQCFGYTAIRTIQGPQLQGAVPPIIMAHNPKRAVPFQVPNSRRQHLMAPTWFGIVSIYSWVNEPRTGVHRYHQGRSTPMYQERSIGQALLVGLSSIVLLS